jgi:hypothetical protein
MPVINARLAILSPENDREKVQRLYGSNRGAVKPPHRVEHGRHSR